jgi:hypothetical protein
MAVHRVFLQRHREDRQKNKPSDNIETGSSAAWINFSTSASTLSPTQVLSNPPSPIPQAGWQATLVATPDVEIECGRMRLRAQEFCAKIVLRGEFPDP